MYWNSFFRVHIYIDLLLIQENLQRLPSSSDPQLLVPKQLASSASASSFLSFARLHSLLPSSSLLSGWQHGHIVSPCLNEVEVLTRCGKGDWEFDGSDAYSFCSTKQIIDKVQTRSKGALSTSVCSYLYDIYALGALSRADLVSLSSTQPSLLDYIRYYGNALSRLYNLVISGAQDTLVSAGRVEWLSLVSSSTLTFLRQYKQSVRWSEYITPMQLRKACTRSDLFNAVQIRFMQTGMLPHPSVWLFYVYYLLLHIEDMEIAVACLLKEAVIYGNGNSSVYIQNIAAVLQGIDDVKEKVQQQYELQSFYDSVGLLQMLAADAKDAIG